MPVAQEFSCTVQNIRFKADDTGYVILAVERPDDFESITAVGTMPDATKGMVVTMSGSQHKVIHSLLRSVC